MNHFSFSPLPVKVWTERAKQHQALVSPYAEAYLERRKQGLSHPVHDFLFTYYNCSPSKLKRWVPSMDESLIMPLEIQKDYPWFNDCWFSLEDNILSLNKAQFHKNIFSLASFIAELCGNILQRPPRFGCFGLHEWAMVYKLSEEEVRHKNHSLRMSSEQLAGFVESQTLRCTHYDAYRFFTPTARPLNLLTPKIETRLQLEQGGCVHANMDLYKWSFKLWPWIGSDFLAKTFLLAVRSRELDMRASPYDLSKEGYPPICIETEEGRLEYQKEQKDLAESAIPLRKELQLFCQRLVSHHQSEKLSS
jgi:hypothetical protein